MCWKSRPEKELSLVRELGKKGDPHRAGPVQTLRKTKALVGVGVGSQGSLPGRGDTVLP